MKTKTFLFFIALIPAIVNAQWVQSSGPRSCTVYRFAKDGQNIFAVTESDGVFLTTDYGENWGKISPQQVYPHDILIYQKDIYLFQSGAGVYKSTDYGLTWSQIEKSLPSKDVNTVSILQKNILIGTSQGISISTDQGISWIFSNAGIPEDTLFFSEKPGWGIDTIITRDVKKIVNDGYNFFTHVRKGGMFFSSDYGMSWKLKNDGLPDSVSIDCLKEIEKTIYLVTSKGELYIYVSEQSKWEKINKNPMTYIEDIVVDGKTIYIARYNGVFVSSSNEQWVTIPEIQNEYVRSLVFNSNYLLAAVIDRGVLRTNNTSIKWEYKNSGFPYKMIYSLNSLDENLYAGTDRGVYISSDKGMNWIPKSNFTGQVFTLSINGSFLYASNFGTVYMSLDRGESWQKINDGLPGSDVRSLFSDGKTLYAGTWGGGVYQIENGGTSWKSITPGIQFIYSNSIVKFDSKIFVGIPGGYYCISLSDGKVVYRSMWNDFISFSIHKEKLFAATLLGVCIYNQQLDNWDFSNNALPTGSTASNIVSNGKQLFIYSKNQNSEDIYLSNDDGKNWSIVKPKFPHLSKITSFWANDLNLFVSTSDLGIWRASINEIITDIGTDEVIPNSFSLSQNYPNPFNPETTISYKLPASSNVSLKVYDVLGREVATLVEEFKQAGNYNVKFNVETCRGKSLPSGIYFYRLQIYSPGRGGNYNETKKMILMK